MGVQAALDSHFPGSRQGELHEPPHPGKAFCPRVELRFLIDESRYQPPIKPVCLGGPLDRLFIPGKARLNPPLEFFDVQMVEPFHVSVVPVVYVLEGAILFNPVKELIDLIQKRPFSLFYGPGQGLWFFDGKSDTNIRVIATIQQGHVGIRYGHLDLPFSDTLYELFCGDIVTHFDYYIKARSLQSSQSFLIRRSSPDVGAFSLQVVNSFDLRILFVGNGHLLDGEVPG